MITYQFEFEPMLEMVRDKAGRHIGRQLENGIINYLIEEILKDEDELNVNSKRIETKKISVDPALVDC